MLEQLDRKPKEAGIKNYKSSSSLSLFFRILAGYTAIILLIFITIAWGLSSVAQNESVQWIHGHARMQFIGLPGRGELFIYLNDILGPTGSP